MRHATAEGNIFRRFHGHYDGDLTELGLRQLPYLAERFRDIPLAAIYSSDLTRTLKTAQAIANVRNLSVQKETRFREVYVGEWEDLALGEVERIASQQLNHFNHDREKWSVADAESFAECSARFCEALHEVARAHPGQSIAVVSHTAVITSALSRIFPNLEKKPYDNTAVTQLTYDGTFHLDYIADRTHLPEELTTLYYRQKLIEKTDRIGGRNLWFQPYEGEIDWYLRFADDEIPVAPMAVITFAMLNDRPVGMLQLDPQNGQDNGIGHIDYLMLDKKYRNHMLGIQLIGEAVSYYRALGRNKLRISVLPRYARCKGWLEQAGFYMAEDGIYEKNIKVQA